MLFILINYGEDDDTPEYEKLYDDGVDVNAEV